MLQKTTNQNALPLIMQFVKAVASEGCSAEYAYNDVMQKPEYRLDWVVTTKTNLKSGGWTWDQKISKTPPKVKK